MERQSRVIVHCVLTGGSAKYRINTSWRGRINRQLVLLLRRSGHRVFLVYCMADQLHVVLQLNRDHSVEEMALGLREHSLRMINDVVQEKGRFFWLPGYIANSVGAREIPELMRKIRELDEEFCDDFNEAFVDVGADDYVGPPAGMK